MLVLTFPRRERKTQRDQASLLPACGEKVAQRAG